MKELTNEGVRELGIRELENGGKSKITNMTKNYSAASALETEAKRIFDILKKTKKCRKVLRISEICCTFAPAKVFKNTEQKETINSYE